MEYTTSQTVARFKDIQQTLASQNREKIVAMHFDERANGTYIFVKPGKSATLGAARAQPQEAEKQAKQHLEHGTAAAKTFFLSLAAQTRQDALHPLTWQTDPRTPALAKFHELAALPGGRTVGEILDATNGVITAFEKYDQQPAQEGFLSSRARKPEAREKPTAQSGGQTQPAGDKKKKDKLSPEEKRTLQMVRTASKKLTKSPFSKDKEVKSIKVQDAPVPVDENSSPSEQQSAKRPGYVKADAKKFVLETTAILTEELLAHADIGSPRTMEAVAALQDYNSLAREGAKITPEKLKEAATRLAEASQARNEPYARASDKVWKENKAAFQKTPLYEMLLPGDNNAFLNAIKQAGTFENNTISHFLDRDVVRKNREKYGVTEEESAAIHLYTSCAFDVLNPDLRSENPSPQARHVAKLVISAFGKLQAPPTQAVHRKINLAKMPEDVQKIMTGLHGIYDERAFLSTFRLGDYPGDHDTDFQIILSYNTSGRSVDEYSNVTSGRENELLFPPGTRFQVQDVKVRQERDSEGKTVNKYNVVWMEL
jgi:hypothetical protein